MTTRQHIMWTTLVLCVLYRRLTAQPTMDQCSTDDDNSRQLLRMEQMMSMLQSIGERQVSLLEQMHCTLLSTNRHVKENQVDVRCRQDVDGSRTCYKFVRENMMWDQARSYCRAFTDGADLVSIESRIEQDFLSLNLRELHGATYYFHTSGQKGSDGVWRWLATGRPFSYTAWAPEEPSGNGDCLYMWNEKVPGWKTWDDSTDQGAFLICEYNITVPSYCKAPRLNYF